MADIFISYSSEDKTIVKKMAQLLETRGWTVWWDRQIPIGQKYDTVIEEALSTAHCVLVIWTARSVKSEWVKTEAMEAARRNILVPVVLESVNLPLAFKRIESAMLPGWQGDDQHPELPFLYNAIDAILHPKDSDTTNDTSNDHPVPPTPANRKIYAGIALVALVTAGWLLYYYLHNIKNSEGGAGSFYAVLLPFCLAIGTLVFAVTNAMAGSAQQKQQLKFKMAGPVTGLILIVTGAWLHAPGNAEQNVTIRIFDWKKNPISQGNVKIYLKEYIRSQSIDNMGQALFTGIPGNSAGNKMKIEVSSPGYATKQYDTLLTGKPLELVLPLTAIVLISGKIKTAAEMPIRGVEVNVDGTRYYAESITDGSYNLRLEEYTLGDEITLTTSHPQYEDKTVLLRITAPEIKNEDIFLNPVKH